MKRKPKPKPKPQRKGRPKSASKLAARRRPVNGPAVAASAAGPSRGFSRDSSGDADPLAGSALRPLLERYCELAGVKRAALGPDHTELKLPPAERPFFRDGERVSVAFSLDALERDPDAEIAVLGSPFVSQVVEAIRARGARLSLGLIAPESSASSPLSRRARGDEAVELPIPVRDGVAKPGATRLAVHPVGRLAARVVLRAGAGVEEAVVETDVYDLSAGVPVDADVAAAFRALEVGRVEPVDPSAAAAAPVPAREPGELLQLLLSHLREKAAERVATRRALSGVSGWSLACPQCGRPPATLVICRHDHCGCEACSHRCSVCGEDFCVDHGTAECRVDGLPACDEHVQVCASCRLEHCTAHAGVCAEDGHAACTACLAPCGSCGRDVCNRHAQRSHADAPKGSRRLCAACVRYCEGGTNEPVGVDEVAPCASCGKAVCSAHQAVCAVDGQVHCSPHLRRADRSRRLVCARHRGACAEEPAALFASDELAACPICGRGTCELHRTACGYCGRSVCSAELDAESHRCLTCAQLAAVSDPPEAVVLAALAAAGREPQASRPRP